METSVPIGADAAANPLCPSCGRQMPFVRSVPRFAGLPELRSYECRACGVTYTQAVAAAGANGPASTGSAD